MYCLWCWVLGVLLWRSHCCSWSRNLRAVSQAVPHKKTAGDHTWLWESHCGERAWGYKLCPMLMLMLGAAAMHRLVCSVLLEGGFGRDGPWWPCSCGAHQGQDPLAKGVLQRAVPQQPQITVPRSPGDVCVTPDSVPLSISCLDTHCGSAEHSTEAFRPQGGSACWLF